ncbi:hypothetical protein PFISCL1PPCAC_13982, partial [Pristionchus fissidentatus]
EAIYCLASLYSLLVALGACTNALIITATVTSKSLHNTCNILIAFCALSDILHLCGHLPKIIPIFAGQPEISSTLCCLLQIIPNFGVSSGTLLVLLIALDRLIAVRFASFAVRTSVKSHLVVRFHLFLFIFIKFFNLITYLTILSSVICSPPEAFHGMGKNLWVLASLLVYCISIGVYITVWSRMRKVDKTNSRRLTETRMTPRQIPWIAFK